MKTKKTKKIVCSECGTENDVVVSELKNKPERGETFDTFHLVCVSCGARVPLHAFKHLTAHDYHELSARFGMSGG